VWPEFPDERRGLIGEDPCRRRRLALEREGAPDEFTWHVRTERPGGLRSGALARQQVRRRDIVVYLCSFPDLYDPREFAQHESGSSVRRLKVLEPSALQLP